MVLNKTFALADGIITPKLGLRTWHINDAAVVQGSAVALPDQRCLSEQSDRHVCQATCPPEEG